MPIILVALSLISLLFNVALVLLVMNLKKTSLQKGDIDLLVQQENQPHHIDPHIQEEYSKLETIFSTWDQHIKNKKAQHKRAYSVWTKEETRLLKKYYSQLDLDTLSRLHQRSLRSLTSQLSSIRYP